MNRKLIAIIVLGLVLLASLLACGFFGVKAIRRTRLRRAAITAFEKKDYVLAERLLRQYVQKDPNAEAEYVALANIYRDFGNTEMEAQMWQTASSLNPLNREYRENMLNSAVKSASYVLLHNFLGRKARTDDSLSDQELYLYVVSSYRSGYPKDGEEAYKKALKGNAETFHRNELGRMAEFMVNYPNLSESEREDYLNQAVLSEDMVVRFEALYNIIRRAKQNNIDEADYEKLLKQLVETNYFAGTPFLANYYYSDCRFSDAIDILEPYLETIDDMNLLWVYAECCVFEGKQDALKALEKKLRQKTEILQMLADYCEILIAYMEKDEEKLVAAVRKSGKLINSNLSRFIRLQVAIKSKSFNEIRTIAQEIFSSDSFFNLHGQALVICLNYLSDEIKKPENQKDPSQMAELAKILSGYLQGNRLLTEIILMDQYKRGLVKEEDLMASLEQFPDDDLLQRVTAEYLILKGKAEQALPIVEQLLNAAKEKELEPDFSIMFLHVLALDQLGRNDEAWDIFQKLLELSKFDMDLLAQYFLFCVTNKRLADLEAMADKLDSVKDGKLEQYGTFFRAAALLLSEDGSRKDEALDMLVSTPTDDPEFTFYAANKLCEHDRLDDAEAKYKAILKTFHSQPLILVNISEIYQEKGDEQKALEAAKEAFELEKQSMLPAFIYAKRLSELERYEDAVNALNFPHRAVNFREDVVELWTDCMHHVIGKSIAEERYLQAEEQCKHLLTIVPDDAFGTENLAKVREKLKLKKDDTRTGDAGAAPAA